MTGDGVLAVIPARYASTRFPAKPLALIRGEPMVLWVLRAATASASVSRVIVATDDRRIAEVVEDAGGEVAMTSPELPSGSDRVWAAAAGIDAPIVLNIQGDEPLLPPTVVDALVTRLRDDPAADVATPVVVVPRATTSRPDAVTVACGDDGYARYFSRSTIPANADPVLRHIGLYAYRREALATFVAAPPSTLERTEQLEQLRALELGLRIATVPVDMPMQAVDRPEDIVAVERHLDGRPRRIRVVVLDCDGVLTEGRISYPGAGDQLLEFDVKDGYGLAALRRAGVAVAIISSRDAVAVHRRADELGFADVRTSVRDKAAALRDLCSTLGVALDEVCYVGDDEPDLPAIAIAGSSAAPSDAVPAVLDAVTLRLSRPGGRGAVRELADRILAEQGAAATGP